MAHWFFEGAKIAHKSQKKSTFSCGLRSLIWKAKLKLLDNIGLKFTNLINSIEITLSDCAPTPIFMSKNTIFWGVF